VFSVLTAALIIIQAFPLATHHVGATKGDRASELIDTGGPNISITSLGTPITQNFDTLVTTGTTNAWTDDTTLTGWYSQFSLLPASPTTYRADSGGSNTGAIYSWGVAGTNPITERAFGSIASGTPGNIFNAIKLTNNTGSTITSFDISYNGEQWRNGGNATAQQLNFQYQIASAGTITDANTPATGWTDFDSLDFVSPVTGAAVAVLDGNAAANRTAKLATLTVTVNNGQEIWLRWQDLNDAGNDHGLAVDDFSITPQGAGGGPTLTVSDVTLAEGASGTTAFNFTVSLSTTVHGGVTFDIATADGTAEDDNPATEDNDYVPQSLTGQTIPNGSDSYNFSVSVNGDGTTEPNETFFVNVTNVTGATVADGQGQGTITNDDIALTPIHQIQGNGDTTPIPGAIVTTTGIVTLLKTGSNAGGGAANGFFLQARDVDADADPNTSEGIFVFTSAVPTYTSPANPVALGDELTVTGTVQEFNGLTEITTVTNLTLISTGNPVPTAITLSATDLDPTASPTQPQLEKYEAMRVTASTLTTVAPNDNFFDVYAVLPSVPRPFREPGIEISLPVPPDPTSGTPDPNIPRWDENPERIKVDTNGRAGSANVPYTSNVVFTAPAGPLDFAFGEYRLIPFAISASSNMTAVAAPTPTANEFTVAGFNIENFNNNATQRQKAALGIRTMLHYPDILGHAEIFDLADLQALRDQINNDAVAASDPNPMYEAYLVEADGVSEDSDQDVGFLVKTSRVSVTSVTQERAASTFINPNTGTPETLHDRPPLVLNAVVDPMGANPQPVIVVVNHTRSFIDIELVAGEGVRVRAKRKAQAEDIADLLQDLQVANPGAPVIAVGDYNAFQFNNGYDDPISVMKGTPTPDDQIVVDQSPDLVNPDFVNVIENVPADDRYSFIFEGTPQVLDHVLLNPAALARNSRVAIAHMNSDFPGDPPSAFETNAAVVERNSDHDPAIAYFSLGAPQAAGSLIISEFRHRGPSFMEPTVPKGAAGPPCSTGPSARAASLAPGTPQDNDEFIELYNNTDSDITVSSLDGSEGYALVAADGVTRFVVPDGTVIPARGHFVGVNADGYSLSCMCLADTDYTLDIPDNMGLALFNTANPLLFTMENRLDAVGSTTETNALYKEGAGYPALTSIVNTDHSFYRDLRSGLHKDTGDNAADFLFVEVNGTDAGAGQRLGAPGPENLFHPVQRNSSMALPLLDATQAASAPPNRVREFTSDPGNNSTFGTLTIRRRLVNNTGAPISEVRFRIIQITSFPPPTAGTADLRARTSTPVVVSNINDAATCAAAGAGPPPCTVTVEGTVLGEPPLQPNGGAWNSTLVVPVSGILPGESVDVQFLLGIQQTGLFKFFVNVEVLTETPTAPVSAFGSQGKRKH
jgi:predicted extracellular nuclease